MNEVITIDKLWADYAEALGHESVESLTDAEKRQAYLNAIIEGKQVEPFATFSSLIAWGAKAERIVVDALEEILKGRLEDG